MNREDITRMAREAGFVGMDGDHGALRRFAEIVAAHVRETEFKPDWNNYRQGLADGAAEEREAMVALAAKQGWAMKNEDPFEDAVREISDMRARGQA